MRYILLIILLTSLMSLSCKKDSPYQISNPESVVWNPISKCYLISNAGSGYILSLKNKKEFEVFNKTQLTSPKGMAIWDNILYVTDIQKLVGYNLKDGNEVFRYTIPNAVFLNDVVVAPDSSVYVSDTQNNSIVILNAHTLKGETFHHKDLKNPNGIFYVQQDTISLLYIVSFRSDAPVQVLNLKSRELKSLPNTKISQADGITRDKEGNWLVSSWHDGLIHKFSPDFQKHETLPEKYTSPADIFYNLTLEELCIPMFEANKIDFVSKIKKTDSQTK